MVSITKVAKPHTHQAKRNQPLPNPREHKLAQIRKAVQIRYLLRYQLPRREALSLLLDQPFQAGQHTSE
jgi:hypothetical protein